MRQGLNVEIRLTKAEIFVYTVPGKGDITWDISEAKKRIKEAVLYQIEIDRENMEEIIERYGFDATRLDSVDPIEPGIATVIKYKGKYSLIMIDGVHRCARAYRENILFTLNVLMP